MFDAVPGKILKRGGVQHGPNEAIRTTAVFNGSTWQAGPDMTFARQNHNSVALPNGQVLAVGGYLYTDPDTQNPPSYGPVMRAETFDPASNEWTADPPGVEMTIPRWYDSTAGLLRDARVLAAGGHLLLGVNGENGQIYKPASLFDALGNAAVRPQIGAGAPTTMPYNRTCCFQYSHPGGRPIVKASLTRLCSVTRGFDEDQRFVPLTMTASGGTVTVTAPANANIAPPGWDMLWILDDLGGPCELAAYVRVGSS
jgi:galactose oxidase